MWNKIKKVIRFIHLWLGLTSGLIVFIVAITGCLYAFQDEIQQATQPYRYVTKQSKSFLTPTQIIDVANQALPDKHIHAVMYHDSTHAAKAIYYSYEENYYYFVYINPYTGEVLKVKDEFADFFRIVLDGHFYLWLPPSIGQPLVASATLIFFCLIVTGIILWWPKKETGFKNKLTVKWRAKWRRKNYDLHSVIGFYISWLAIVFVFTGLIWGFQWFRDSIYSIASGGEKFIDYYNPPSDTSLHLSGMAAIDQVWYLMKREYPLAASIEIHPPENALSSIAANANPDNETYWKIDYRYFDQYSLAELPVNHIWNRLQQATTAQLLLRMNYDIHIGSIAGIAGKVFAFLVSLTIASLPVTGIIIWWGRRRKQKHEAKLPAKAEINR